MEDAIGQFFQVADEISAAKLRHQRQHAGGSGFVAGTLIGVLIMGLIQTYIIFDGTLSSWWTKIVIGALLLVFIMLQKGLLSLADRRRSLRASGNT